MEGWAVQELQDGAKEKSNSRVGGSIHEGSLTHGLCRFATDGVNAIGSPSGRFVILGLGERRKVSNCRIAWKNSDRTLVPVFLVSLITLFE